MTRAQKIFVGVLCTVVCGTLGIAGTDQVALECSRGAGGPPLCQVVRTSAFMGERRAPSAIAEVREQRRVSTGKSKGAPRWSVVLLDPRGAEVSFGAYDSPAEAAMIGDRVRAFVRDPGASAFRVETPRGPWPYLLLAAAVAAAVWTVVAARRTASAAPPSPWRERLRKHQGTLRWILVIGIATAAGQGALMWYADRTQGWLVFQVESRCLFGGGEMLPGASVSMSIDPGRHCAKIYNPHVVGGWETQCFDIAIGQTTTVRCRPTAGAPSTAPRP